MMHVSAPKNLTLIFGFLNSKEGFDVHQNKKNPLMQVLRVGKIRLAYFPLIKLFKFLFDGID